METLNVECPNCYALLVEDEGEIRCIFCGWRDDGTLKRLLEEWKE